MAKQTRKKKSKKKPAKTSRFWWGLLLKLTLVFAVLMGIFGIYLDSQVRERFDGQKWALPALVYSRPLELYPDQRLSHAQMLRELQLLNYRKVANPKRPGEYSVGTNRIEIYRRSFNFSDGAEKSRRFLLSFSGQRLTRMQNPDNGRELGYGRMDPVLLDRLNVEKREDRLLVRLDQVPELLKTALITVEDRDFYQHGGVSPLAILRALVVNIKAGRTVQGGSTLTQQLAKNFFLTQDRSLWRKVQEAYMALIIDFRYSKDDILEAYFNEVYLGQNGNQGVYGFGLASYFYFGVPLNELNPDQIALMVALVKGPSFYDPWRNGERAQKRRDLVLRLLANDGHIDRETYEQASSTPLRLIKRGQMGYGRTPAFMGLLRQELQDRFGGEFLRQNGLKIFSSLDPIAQHSAEQAISEQLTQLKKRTKKKDLEAAMVVTNWRKGEVSAVVGGADPSFAGFNRALAARRPIGSLIKPPVYAQALADGFTLGSAIEDKPISLRSAGGQVWKPNNYDRQFRGQVMLVDALAKSLNVPTVNLGMAVGLDKVIKGLKRMGVRQDIPAYPSLLLGTLELTPLEVNQLYLTLANQGLYQPLTSIRAIQDDEGELLYQHNAKATQVLSPEAGYLALYGMTRVVGGGTASHLAARFPNRNMAGKTGTTNDLRDAWYAGLDNEELASVWVGRDNNGVTGLTGASGALRVYSRYLDSRGVDSLQLRPPVGVDQVNFAYSDGMPADPRCEETRLLPAKSADLPSIRGCEPSMPSLPEAGEKVGDWLKDIFNFAR
ncbi:penicillin-binding protein 1B [Oceanisphaera pacifica]|uniref:Penicillin-binding protein 1B n=1 Tax=Oceanisphaera pacifica TaxID=2818389 RepID=A0ABS3NIJ7_9GAMM|nr:penicillin-binding protein 1B [Oceanisphaera pacifica]MBO1520370.1 penicillin-binding protein 1B [Oceanisphaera pacifica]